MNIEALAEEQIALARFLKGEFPETELSPYMLRLNESKGLQALRWSIDQWCRFNLTRGCKLTIRALTLTSAFEDVYAKFRLNTSSPALVEALCREFLYFVCGEQPEAIAAIARYELILIAATRCPQDSWDMEWPYSPREAIHALATGAPLPNTQTHRLRYRVRGTAPYVFERISDILEAGANAGNAN